jgi:hypothetical protein
MWGGRSVKILLGGEYFEISVGREVSLPRFRLIRMLALICLVFEFSLGTLLMPMRRP